VHRRFIVPGALAATLLLAIPAAASSGTVGAPGIGDPYYPASGNGGYDVSHYGLRLKYQPTTDLLEGTATILATTTQDLTRFNLDFGLAVSEVRVNGKKASYARTGAQELEITPVAPLAKGKDVSVVVRYAGKPSELKINGWTAWARTPDGGVAAQEPESAVWWYPSNDHPLDKATYDISVSVPDGTQAISNGVLQSQSSKLGWTRFNWRSDKPQAWINEGFARYSQWLWSEKEGEGAAQELADHVYAQHPANDPFWKVKPGDPGPDKQFDIAVTTGARWPSRRCATRSGTTPSSPC